MRLPYLHNKLPVVVLILSSSILTFFWLNKPKTVFSLSPNILISEIKVAGNTANDEFVELYNPTNSDVSINNWRLSKRTSSLNGAISNLVTNLSGSISARGYFLIANPQYSGLVEPDFWYSATTSGIAANNTVILYSDQGLTIVDKVGMGSAEDNETASTVLPPTGSSIERKAKPDSTSETLYAGGIDELMGNGHDTDNNSQDFVLRQNPEPQNHLYQEYYADPTPTSTINPTPTPTPLISPTSNPTPTINPTETPMPTSTPNPTVTILPTLGPTITPTLTPSPTKTPPSQAYTITCKTAYKQLKILFGVFNFPFISCSLQKK